MSLSSRSTPPREPELTAEQAKAILLDWADQADEDLYRQINNVIGSVRATTRKATPWAIGAAAIFGLLFARRRRSKGESPGKAGAGPLRLGIRLALELLPLVTMFLRSRPRDNPPA